MEALTEAAVAGFVAAGASVSEPCLHSDGSLIIDRVVVGNQAAQHAFFADCRPGWTLAQGGWGSGKTWVGARKFLVIHLLNECPGLVVAPTDAALWLLCVPELERACTEWGVDFTTHPHGRGKDKKAHMIIEGQPVWLFSAEEPRSITGIEVGHVWGDEAARYPASREDPLRNAILQIRGRLRHPAAKTLHGLFTTTPEGTETPVQADFIDEGTKKQDHRVYFIPTRGNRALPADYVSGLLSGIPAELVDQYIDGKAVSYIANRAHPTFARARHVSEFDRHPSLPLHVGCDYNVSPMCWVLAQVAGDVVSVLDEVVLKDFGQVDTAVHEAHAKGWGGPVDASRKLVRPEFLTFHPDKSAKARSTVGDPEFVAMTKAAKALGWNYSGNAGGVNPPVDARINHLSRLLLDATGRTRMRIHPRCTTLIADLERTARGSSGYDPGSEGKRGHILDALGYLAWDVVTPMGAMGRVADSLFSL